MSLWSQALDWMFPPTCPGCGVAHPPWFCSGCQGRMPAIGDGGCRCCGVPFAGASAGGNLCGRCLREVPHFRKARACATYVAGAGDADPLRRTLHRYKYGREARLAKPLGRLLLERCPLAPGDYDVIVPIPLHLERLRWRGFNQAQLLAAEFSQAHRLPVDAFAVERVRATAPQVGQDAAARRRNVRDAFRARDPARLRGQCVLLIDDVYTSGATANECSRAVATAGADYVDVLVLAHALTT